MTDSEEIEVPDRTNTRKFLQEQADRMLAWEYVHTVFCAGKHLRPSKIAERAGIPLAQVYAIIENIENHAKGNK